MTHDSSDRAGSGLERSPVADLWRNTLSRISSTFGRLAYLSSLRDPNTGVYAHYGLAQIFGAELTDQALRESHVEEFSRWLCFNLQQQKADLDEYLSTLDEDVRTVVATWLRVASYRNLIPSEAKRVEQELYMADLEAVLELLRHEHGVALPDAGA
jgi:hypothetical protein